ncbi:Na+/H+ antiporter NhaA [Rubrobacter naiadicus]|uniref:Na+/H+ antiporter NhaA n=1 Tax=Rubrobacter naiadicus TaxID=1392641 RepID=UPI003B5A6EDA
MSSVREQPPVERIVRPFQDFADKQSSGGILLMVATAAALVWANSPWAGSYSALWHTKMAVSMDGFSISKDLAHWINDGLMAVFFLVVGLEIKREVLVGELSSLRGAMLPVFAALGGAVVPASIYLAINAGTRGAGGWGIPMATDIAFALGILALLGRRVPVELKVFLAALAIVDDIVAVLVIAIFYTPRISWEALGAGGVFLGALVVANLLGVGRTLVYAVLGIGLWVCFLLSGVHATVAGILLAFTVPASSFINAGEFLEQGRYILDRFERAGDKGENVLTNEERQAALHALNHATYKLEPPLQELEHALHPWVAFVIMPLFALANAGIPLGGNIAGALTSPVTLGIVLGLVAGKQIGITLFTWLAVKSGLSELPGGIGWRHVYGGAWLAGIGFTMSLFITELAFSNGGLVEPAKLGILLASLISGAVGWTILRMTAERNTG